MSWQIAFKITAKKDISKLNPIHQKRIGQKIDFFMHQPNPVSFAIKLTPGKMTEQYRWRIGDYRILFDVKGKKITVLAVAHRRGVYKK